MRRRPLRGSELAWGRGGACLLCCAHAPAFVWCSLHAPGVQKWVVKKEWSQDWKATRSEMVADAAAHQASLREKDMSPMDCAFEDFLQAMEAAGELPGREKEPESALLKRVKAMEAAAGNKVCVPPHTSFAHTQSLMRTHAVPLRRQPSPFFLSILTLERSTLFLPWFCFFHCKRGVSVCRALCCMHRPLIGVCCVVCCGFLSFCMV